MEKFTLIQYTCFSKYLFLYILRTQMTLMSMYCRLESIVVKVITVHRIKNYFALCFIQ